MQPQQMDGWMASRQVVQEIKEPESAGRRRRARRIRCSTRLNGTLRGLPPPRSPPRALHRNAKRLISYTTLWDMTQRDGRSLMTQCINRAQCLGYAPVIAS